MGEVYRARDARLLASLNHSRIGAIYELEDHEGLGASLSRRVVVG